MSPTRTDSEPGAARILLATDNADDAQMIRKMLREEFSNVIVSSDPNTAEQDFDAHRPEVLMLAFDTLEKSERYYLGLYRMCAAVQTVPHRTILLCNKDNVRQVYQLCRKEHFDDYVLFWPMNHDATRLLMAVHHALHVNALVAARSSAGEISAHVRQIGSLESQLQNHAARGRHHADAIGQSLQQASQDMSATLDRLSHWLGTAQGGGVVDVRQRAQIAREIERIKAEDLARHVQSATATLQPAQRWAGDLQRSLAGQADSVRSVKAFAEQSRRLVLIVDDDPFQCKLLERILGDAGFDTAVAGSAIAGLAAVGRRRPDLVLMDVELPDFSGVEATGRIKAVEGLANIPVLMITGHSNKDVIFSSVMAGSAGFLVKPFDKAALLAKVSRCLEASAAVAGA